MSIYAVLGTLSQDPFLNNNALDHDNLIGLGKAMSNILYRVIWVCIYNRFGRDSTPITIALRKYLDHHDCVMYTRVVSQLFPEKGNYH